MLALCYCVNICIRKEFGSWFWVSPAAWCLGSVLRQHDCGVADFMVVGKWKENSVSPSSPSWTHLQWPHFRLLDSTPLRCYLPLDSNDLGPSLQDMDLGGLQGAVAFGIESWERVKGTSWLQWGFWKGIRNYMIERKWELAIIQSVPYLAGSVVVLICGSIAAWFPWHLWQSFPGEQKPFRFFLFCEMFLDAPVCLRTSEPMLAVLVPICHSFYEVGKVDTI